MRFTRAQSTQGRRCAPGRRCTRRTRRPIHDQQITPAKRPCRRNRGAAPCSGREAMIGWKGSSPTSRAQQLQSQFGSQLHLGHAGADMRQGLAQRRLGNGDGRRWPGLRRRTSRRKGSRTASALARRSRRSPPAAFFEPAHPQRLDSPPAAEADRPGRGQKRRGVSRGLRRKKRCGPPIELASALTRSSSGTIKIGSAPGVITAIVGRPIRWNDRPVT
jgi:hypothetical protein